MHVDPWRTLRGGGRVVKLLAVATIAAPLVILWVAWRLVMGGGGGRATQHGKAE